MSALPLNEAAPISDGASFYNPVEVISYVVETTPETGEGVSPPQNNYSTQSMRGSMPLGGGFQIAADPDSAQASYIGEDGRLTLLREIHTMFRTMAAANSSGSSASIPQETLRLLPIISRTVIQFVGELQANNSQLRMSHAQLQATQENRQAGERQTEARIDLLQREVELLKDAKRELELKNDGLKRDISEVERSYADIKAQKDSLKAELGLGATSDSGIEGSSKKRRHLE